MVIDDYSKEGELLNTTIYSEESYEENNEGEEIEEEEIDETFKAYEEEDDD